LTTERDGHYKKERVDFIISKSKRWRSAEVKLLGTEPLVVSGSGEQNELFASDHFGVYGKYIWQKAKMKESRSK